MVRETVKRAVRSIALLALALAAGCSSSNGGGGGSGGAGGGAAPGSGGSAPGTGGRGSGGASGDAATADAPMEIAAPTSSGVATAKMLGDLSADEKKKLCDFHAAQVGGYGMAVDCGNGTTITADDSLDACLGPDGLGGDCAKATVGDFETCVKDTTCDDPQPDSCQALIFCN